MEYAEAASFQNLYPFNYRVCTKKNIRLKKKESRTEKYSSVYCCRLLHLMPFGHLKTKHRQKINLTTHTWSIILSILLSGAYCKLKPPLHRQQPKNVCFCAHYKIIELSAYTSIQVNERKGWLTHKKNKHIHRKNSLKNGRCFVNRSE